MKVKFSVFSCTLVMSLFLISVSAFGAPMEETYSGWDIFGTEKHFELRYGNGATNGDWELGKKDGSTVVENEQLTWTNSVDKSFTLSHDLATGDLSFTIDSKTLTWDFDPYTAFGKISILAKVNQGDDWTSTVSNLVFDGSPLTLSLTADQTTNKSGVFLTDGLFSDFTLTGDVAFSWTSLVPRGSRAEMFIGVADATQIQAAPEPGTLLLIGTGLVGLVGYRRKFKS